MTEEYREALAYLQEKLGSHKAVCNCLGLYESTIKYRLDHNAVKIEHILAMEALINRIDR